MDSHLVPGDPILVENIVSYLKAMGVFDEFRHECLADVDTKSSCQNLSQRVDGYTSKFLANETWNPDMNKNEVRNKLRKHIDESGMLAVGADHVVEQVINPKIQQLFLPKIIDVVHQYLNNEKEKQNKKQEIAYREKLARETPNENTTKSKPVLDPIADILSFTYSKPKQAASAQHPQSKVTEGPKVDKRKEESTFQTKSSEFPLKVEKKEDLKPKKEDISDLTAGLDVIANSDKKEEVVNSMKTEAVELSKESVLVSAAKLLEDTGKVSKDVKDEECSDPSLEATRKPEKAEVKNEKKKSENLKLQIPDKSTQSEDSVDSKSSPSVPKSGSSSKTKLEHSKHKKDKHLGSSKTKTSESHKSSMKESSDSSDKVCGDQTKTSLKMPKPHTKDQPLKNNISTKMVKCEKDGNKNKTKPSSSSDKHASSKSASAKKEDSSTKLKHSSDKQDKTKTSSSKSKNSESSSADKGSKTSSQYSSSYDSSNQGSDLDRSSASSSKEKLKHFSKHHRKDGSSLGSFEKPSSKKPSQSDSDSGTPQKVKKIPSEHKKSRTVQECAKIDSRSDSFGSVSSTSDSQTSIKESSISTSEETSDTSSKSSEKKLVKESCSGSQRLPPPSPPPPPSGQSIPGTSSSAELSSMEDTQSSEASEESDASEDSEGHASSQSDEESDASISNQKQDTKSIPDIRDVFLASSSSSEFEGFASSPEKPSKSKKVEISDATASLVNSSEVSSGEDELSEHNEQPEKQKSKKKFTVKKAKEILKAKAEQQRQEASKIASQKDPDWKKNSRGSSQSSSAVFSLAETEVPPPEPKRESRRERKLNPKYASSEYTSIFDSKRTSFITKQNDGRSAASPEAKKIEAEEVRTPVKRKTSVTTVDKSQASRSESKVQTECDTLTMKYTSEDISSNLHPKESADRNHNSVDENEPRSRIALKIKISSGKNDNETNKDPHGTKRKFEGDEKGSAKRTCHQNASGLGTNENKPLNSKPRLSSTEHGKEVFHKQKVSNGNVLNKVERRNSVSKTNHVNEKQPGD